MEEKKNSGFKENYLENIKSNYVLQRIFDNIQHNKLLQIVKYNKNIQFRLNKDINDYKNYNKVIIEIFPINKYNKNYFIQYEEQEKQYYHLYFNDEKEEKQRVYFNDDEYVTKIKIIIDNQITSFEGLFNGCE